MVSVDEKHKTQASQQYDLALRQAAVRKLKNFILHRCNDLVPAGEVIEHLNLEVHKQPVVQQVPLDQIVGSAGRYKDFDLEFYPLHRGTRDRWIKVASAQSQGAHLPPVLLYKVGTKYFVEDGNHRVSVARMTGQKTILAQVIELESSNLIQAPTCFRLGFENPDKSHPCKRPREETL